MWKQSKDTWKININARQYFSSYKIISLQQKFVLLDVRVYDVLTNQAFLLANQKVLY